VQRHKTTGHDGAPVPKRQRILSEQQSPVQRHDETDETSPLIARFPPQNGQSPPSIRTTQRILPGPHYQEASSFLAGLPYLDNQSTSIPSVPRSKRFPRPSRAQRLNKLTSHLRKESFPDAVPGGALRKSHPQQQRSGPYDRLPPKRRAQEAEIRLSALESHARNLQSQSAGPIYKWGDEEVKSEFHRHYRRPSQRTPPKMPTTVQGPGTISRDPLNFNFKFNYSTPIPTKFEFGGQFTSPPRSGAPKDVTREPVSGIEKAEFTFDLPSERQRSSRPGWTPSVGDVSVKREETSSFGGVKASQSMPALSSHLPQRIEPKSHIQKTNVTESRRNFPAEQENRNTFTIVSQSREKSPFIRKSLPSKSHAMTIQIDHPKQVKQEIQQPHSFPPPNATTIPSPPPSTNSTPGPGHRRTKSVITPTRSSRRHRITATYAQDSHREFIRDLREILGQKKARKEQEEKEIDARIRKLREEEQAVEPTLAGELPRLPELLARKVILAFSAN
jgi:hypothetical protein